MFKNFKTKGEKQAKNYNLVTRGILEKGYGINPKLMWQDVRIPIEAKAILAYFYSYTGNGKNIAFPNRKTILEDLNISKDRYYEHLKYLKQFGYLTIQKNTLKKGGFPNNIYILSQRVSVPDQKSSDEMISDEIIFDEFYESNFCEENMQDMQNIQDTKTQDNENDILQSEQFEQRNNEGEYNDESSKKSHNGLKIVCPSHQDTLCPSHQDTLCPSHQDTNKTSLQHHGNKPLCSFVKKGDAHTEKCINQLAEKMSNIQQSVKSQDEQRQRGERERQKERERENQQQQQQQQRNQNQGQNQGQNQNRQLQNQQPKINQVKINQQKVNQQQQRNQNQQKNISQPPKHKAKEQKMDRLLNLIDSSALDGLKLKGILKEWISSKEEAGHVVTEMQTKALINQTEQNLIKFGENICVEVIETCIASGYKGIAWNIGNGLLREATHNGTNAGSGSGTGSKAPARRKTRFHNYEGRNWDYDMIERANEKLLNRIVSDNEYFNRRTGNKDMDGLPAGV